MRKTSKKLSTDQIAEIVKRIVNGEAEMPKRKGRKQKESTAVKTAKVKVKVTPEMVKRQARLAKEWAEGVRQLGKLNPETEKWAKVLIGACENSKNTIADFKRISIAQYRMAHALDYAA